MMTGPQARTTWRDQFFDELADSRTNWVFVAKAAFGTLLTGWLAMRFDLASPGTAMLTFGIVMYPQSGMVLAKSYYRALGTLVGCAAGIVMIMLFAQNRVLLLLSLATWTGLCAGGGATHRYFVKSYGYLLAAVTALIVTIPVVNTPDQVFQSAIMRGSEVMLGIIVAAVTIDGIFPQHLSNALRHTVRKQFSDFTTFLRGSLRSAIKADDESLLAFVRQVGELETLRVAAVFEDAGVRARSPRLRRLNQRFMAASTTCHSLFRLLSHLTNIGHAKAASRLRGLLVCVSDVVEDIDGDAPALKQAEALSRALHNARPPIRKQIARVRRDLADDPAQKLDFEAGAELCLRFIRELRGYAAAYQGLAQPVSVGRRSSHPDARFVNRDDWVTGVSAFIRTILVLLPVGWFWIETGWQGGMFAMLFGGVLSAILSMIPVNPKGPIRTMAKWFTFSGIAAFVCLFALMPRIDDFVPLAALLVPCLVVGYYLLSRPATYLTGRMSVLGFMIFLEAPLRPATLMQYDLPTFTSSFFGLMSGLIVASTMFSIFATASENRFLYRHMLKRLRSGVVHAANDPLRGARHRLESASRGQFLEIIAVTAPDSDTSKNLLGWTLSVIASGRIIMDLRHDLLAMPPALAQPVKDTIDAVSMLYQKPDYARHGAARRCIAAAMQVAGTCRVETVMRHLHRLQIAFSRPDAVLAQFVPPQALTEGEVTHAA